MAIDSWPRGVIGEWNDVKDDNTLPYIVEYPIPEPGHFTLTVAILGIVLLRRRHLPKK